MNDPYAEIQTLNFVDSKSKNSKDLVGCVCDELKSISPTFFEHLLCKFSFAKKIQSQTVSREKLYKTLSNKKAARR